MANARQFMAARTAALSGDSNTIAAIWGDGRWYASTSTSEMYITSSPRRYLSKETPIVVTPGHKIKTTGGLYRYFAFYLDAEKNQLGGRRDLGNEGVTYTVPNGASYLVVNCEIGSEFTAAILDTTSGAYLLKNGKIYI